MGILTQNKGLLAGAATQAVRVLATLPGQDCLLCGISSGSDILCPDCARDLPRLPGPSCPRCALPTPAGELCGHCLSHAPHYDATLAAFRYGFPVDKLIHAFKYGHRLALAPYLGRHLARLAEVRLAGAVDLIVPLPLHIERLRERGFNQALELARPVGAALNLPVDAGCCSRVRHTPAQADLPWGKREKNIRAAFHCPEDLTGKRVILVDDVMTTGASLNECARTLKLHGAAEVTLLVVARTLPGA